MQSHCWLVRAYSTSPSAHTSIDSSKHAGVQANEKVPWKSKWMGAYNAVDLTGMQLKRPILDPVHRFLCPPPPSMSWYPPSLCLPRASRKFFFSFLFPLLVHIPFRSSVKKSGRVSVGLGPGVADLLRTGFNASSIFNVYERRVNSLVLGWSLS